jgi:pimeloyl-ACP methyl ester carboxylesterase
MAFESAESGAVSATDSFCERSVASWDGTPVRCFHTNFRDDKPTMLIVLPFGIPAEVARPAFEALEPKLNVVTWEGRYILNAALAFVGSEHVSPADYVRDVLAILHAVNVPSCSIIGYCSGAGIALLAATQHPDVFTDLILVSGEYQLFRRGHVSTAYQRSIDSFLPVVSRSRDDARMVFSTMSEVAKANEAQAASELQKQMSTPFSTEEHLFRYARTYMAYRDFDALQTASGIQQATFVVTGGLDEHSNMENSEAVYARVSKAKLFVDDQGDHYAFCRRGSLTLDTIAAHVSV